MAPVEIDVKDTPLRMGFTIRISGDPDEKGRSAGDWFIVRIYSKATPRNVPTELRFISRQGKFKLAMADLTGDGVEELLTINNVYMADQRGTELLQVWVWNHAGAPRILDILVAGYVGSEHWWYEPELRDLNGDGVFDLGFRRGDSSTVHPGDDPTSFPQPGTIGYAFEPKSRRMEPVMASR